MVDGALLHRTVVEYERLDAERMATQESQAEVIKAAVEAGLDKTILKRFIRELRRDAALMKAERDLLDDYREAYSRFEATPLGAYAKGSTKPTNGKAQMAEIRKLHPDGDPDLASKLAEAKEREATIDTSIDGMPDDPPAKPKSKRAQREAARLQEAAPQPEPMFDGNDAA